MKCPIPASRENFFLSPRQRRGSRRRRDYRRRFWQRRLLPGERHHHATARPDPGARRFRHLSIKLSGGHFKSLAAAKAAGAATSCQNLLKPFVTIQRTLSPQCPTENTPFHITQSRCRLRHNRQPDYWRFLQLRLVWGLRHPDARSICT